MAHKLIQKLYCYLYKARNDFLHGNPVTPNKLFPSNKPGGLSLLQCAPLIYEPPSWRSSRP